MQIRETGTSCKITNTKEKIIQIRLKHEAETRVKQAAAALLKSGIEEICKMSYDDLRRFMKFHRFAFRKSEKIHSEQITPVALLKSGIEEIYNMSHDELSKFLKWKKS